VGTTAEVGVRESTEGGESGGEGRCAGEGRKSSAAGDGEGRAAAAVL